MKLLSEKATSYKSQADSVAQEIQALRSTLSKELTIRRQKEEYESLASVINSSSTLGTSQLQVEIDRVKEETNEIERMREGIDNEVREKEKAFQMLLCGIHDLKRLLGEEDLTEDAGGSGAGATGNGGNHPMDDDAGKTGKAKKEEEAGRGMVGNDDDEDDEEDGMIIE